MPEYGAGAMDPVGQPKTSLGYCYMFNLLLAEVPTQSNCWRFRLQSPLLRQPRSMLWVVLRSRDNQETFDVGLD